MTEPDFQARHCIDFACFTQTLLKPNFMRILPSNVVPNLHLEYLKFRRDLKSSKSSKVYM